ncbi:MAG: methyltransferase domain-containing protein [Magnetococcus sp. WYHC-3]
MTIAEFFTRAIRFVFRKLRVAALSVYWINRCHARRCRPETIAEENRILACLRGRSGIEIGGPSDLFRFGVPVYGVVRSLDNLDFALRTTWSGNRREHAPFRFHWQKRPGRQHIADATDLSLLRDGTYDFVLSCHNLEHIANPLKALREFVRVIKPGGYILLVLPNKESMFDHRRDYTTFEHVLADEANHVGEDSLLHLAEVLEKHDLARDPCSGTPEQFRARLATTAQTRLLHHHVFNGRLLRELAAHLGLCVDFVGLIGNDNLVAFLHKVAPDCGGAEAGASQPDNGRYSIARCL